jgi:hypothetical protein
MGKLLQNRLPLAMGQEVTPDTFNRAVRVLELNLNAFDTTATPQYNDSQINQLAFQTGDVIWNTSGEVLQVYTGSKFEDLSTGNRKGISATGEVGSVQVITGGSLIVEVG